MMRMQLLAACAVLISASASSLTRSAFMQQARHFDDDNEKKSNWSGGSAALAERPVEEWKAESSFPKSVQYLFASTWIIMLSLIPFLLPIIEKKAPTRTQMIVGGCMLATLLGGIYLFTNVILFQSVHFNKLRSLTIVECIYFMAQVITTVGYGDITPAFAYGQMFVGAYVLGALFVIAMLISNLTDHMCKLSEEYEDKMRVASALECRQEDPLHNIFKQHKPSAKPLAKAFLTFLVLDICWIVFFAMNPGENKTWFQATYMATVTMSTVGFGWFTPLTEGGMIFAAFWMLFGSAALVDVIGEFTALMIHMHHYELVYNSERQNEANLMLKSIVPVRAGIKQTVTETEFLHFGLLQMKLVTPQDLERISKAFKKLAPGGENKVPLAVVEEALRNEWGYSHEHPYDPLSPKTPISAFSSANRVSGR